MINIKTRSKIKLEAMDAAVILRSDGSIEASLPEIEEGPIPDNVLVASAVMFFLSRPDLCDAIFKEFVQECQKNEAPANVIHLKDIIGK